MSEGDSFDLGLLLFPSKEDFLIRSNGDQVKFDSLKGKKVGLYFSASWCQPCERFTPMLEEVYNELAPKADFEIVFVTHDQYDDEFEPYFAKMPWLAIPFSDKDKHDRLIELFNVRGIPHLVILDESGSVLTTKGYEIVWYYGGEAYPFTQERIKELKLQEETARREQSLKSLLVFGTRDYVISSDGKRVPVSELEGKIVGLYFTSSLYYGSVEFTPTLVEVYNQLKEMGENFEIVLISEDDEQEGFQESFTNMPWLGVPFKDKTCWKLGLYFDTPSEPTLVIIGSDGKTLHPNAAQAIDDHGVLAYPFTPEKLAELEEIRKAKEAAQTLESILVSGDKDFVIRKDGAKIPVSDLVGKNILLYFSDSGAFLRRMIEAYNKIKAKDDAFEVIFISISSDSDEAYFKECFSEMPWLALPFGDERTASLSRTFKVPCLGKFYPTEFWWDPRIPMLVALGPTGRTITKEAKDLIWKHGADAYPFTDERLKELEAKYEGMKKEWPEKVKHALHDEEALHEDQELVLTRRNIYICKGCHQEGRIWSFNCKECCFDVHPDCALKNGEETEEKVASKNPEDGWVCEGDVCRRV